MPLYLEESIEREMGIQFRSPTQKESDELRYILDNAAAYLGYDDSFEVIFPEKGVLVEQLTTHQRNMIGLLLGAKYAKQNADHQSELAAIPVHDCNERMISLEASLKTADVHFECSQNLFHEACEEYAHQSRIWFLRTGVVAKLIPVFTAFNQAGFTPHLEDAYRPKEVQKGLLLRRIVDLAREWKEWTWQDIKAVGTSLTAPSPGLAGHQAGAAIDVRLKKTDTGEFLELGNEYAEGSPICAIGCPYVTFEQLQTRVIFSQFMRMANFKLLPTENWHASHGDRGMGIDTAARKMVVRMRQAIYGPLLGFDPSSGRVLPYPEDAIDQPYLQDGDMQWLVEIARSPAVTTTMEALRIFRSRPVHS